MRDIQDGFRQRRLPDGGFKVRQSDNPKAERERERETGLIYGLRVALWRTLMGTLEDWKAQLVGHNFFFLLCCIHQIWLIRDTVKLAV